MSLLLKCPSFGNAFLKNAFKINVTNLWQSDNPIEVPIVFWKQPELLVIIRSMQLWLLKLLQHVLSLTLFDALLQLRKYLRVTSDSSGLKPPINRNLSYQEL